MQQTKLFSWIGIFGLLVGWQVPILSWAQPFKVMAYFTADGVEQRNYLPADVPADKITHLYYAFAIPQDVNQDGNFEAVMNSDEVAYNQIMVRHVEGTNRNEGEMKGILRQLRVLKRQNPHLKILLSVGGACYYDAATDQCLALSPLFRTISQSKDRTEYFLNSLIQLMTNPFPNGEDQNLFDGIDLDWEFPVEEDKNFYIPFVAELRRKLDLAGTQNQKRYLLTVDGAATNYFIQHVDIKALEPLVDWVNVLTYLFHMPQSWNNHTGHNAPLTSTSADAHGQGYDVQNASIGVWHKGGMPLEKLALGLPAFGIGYKKVPKGNSPYPGLYEKYSSELVASGEIPYTVIWTEHFRQGGFQTYWDDRAQVPFMYNERTKAWISYDDARSLSLKTVWAKEKNLAGVFLWELSQESIPNEPNSPLMGAIDRAFKTGFIPETASETQVFPNSSNQAKQIVFQVFKPSQTQIRVYDPNGNEVIKLLDQYLVPGTYKTTFRPQNRLFTEYLCKITNEYGTQTIKLSDFK